MDGAECRVAHGATRSISGSEKKTEWPKRYKNPGSTRDSVAFVSITIFG